MKKLTSITFNGDGHKFSSKYSLSFGLPFPSGEVKKTSELTFFDDNNAVVHTQFKPLSFWPDGSLQWVGIVLKAPDPTQTVHCFKSGNNTISNNNESNPVDTSYNSNGNSRLKNKKNYLEYTSFEQAEPSYYSLSLYDTNSNKHTFQLRDLREIENGELRNTYKCSGTISPTHSDKIGQDLKVTLLIEEYILDNILKIDIQVHNPHPAKHKDNLWDLGDQNSIKFKGLILEISNTNKKLCDFEFKPDPESGFQKGNSIEILQQSSGGKNWDSSNHVTADGKTFRIYPGGIIQNDFQTLQYKRLSPIVRFKSTNIQISCLYSNFWQNFPSSFSMTKEACVAGVFPFQNDEIYELQPGEKKTTTIYYQSGIAERSVDLSNYPLMIIPIVNTKWYQRCFPWLINNSRPIKNERYYEIVRACIHGEHSFFKKREIIDEYGWRNFGEIYADHESANNTENQHFISHYNNQYDILQSAILHFWMTGDPEWYKLSFNLADHISDIDIYHTDKDRFEFNKGLFWHTSHYTDAQTASHRCYSAKHSNSNSYGGGPSLQHLYLGGLFLAGYMRANTHLLDSAKEALCFCQNNVNGPSTLKEKTIHFTKVFIKKNLQKIKKEKYAFELWDGPGRASGNALRSLIEGFFHTHDFNYITTANKTIDKLLLKSRVDELDLLDAEYKWSYLIYLQALSLYVSVKKAYNLEDEYTKKARLELFNYTEWMLLHETTFLSRSDELEYPNETWCAQDLRKAAIFAFVSNLTDNSEKKIRYMEKAVFFYNKSLDDIQNFKERQYLARPQALLMQNCIQYFNSIYTG